MTDHLIEDAARWLAALPAKPTRPVVVELQTRFGLTALESCMAIAQARGLPVRKGSDLGEGAASDPSCSFEHGGEGSGAAASKRLFNENENRTPAPKRQGGAK